MGIPAGQSPRRANTVFVASAIGLVAIVGLIIALVVVAGSDKGGTAGRRQAFDAGRAKTLATAIDQDGPIPYPDALNRGRPIYIQHLGDDLQTGWRAFGAYDPSKPSCLVDWEDARKVFVNRCDRSTTYPPDGHGLTQFATRIVNDHLIVDLHTS